MSTADDDYAARAQARVGTNVRGKYGIERVLGIGGMATVYAATHRNGRRVALKVLHPELSMRSDVRKRFVRESQAANAVDHPGVVAVIDDDTAEDGAVFLVMELLAGESVEQMWERHGLRLPTRAVLAIAREVCDVLAVAHRAGVVHRDIKPANLFVTEDARLKVLDFGIARARDIASTHATDTGMLLGTPAFMAPEQASGRVSQVDGRTDIWAVGATMFALLAGRAVHEGETAQHVVMLAATQPANSLATIAPEVPREIVEIVDKALALEPGNRWPTAEAMRSAIEAASVALFGEAVLPIERLSATLEVAAAPAPVPRTRPMLPGAEMALRAPIRVLGSTTSSPVSSTAPTEPRHRRWPATLANAPLVRTVALAVSRLRVVIGRTTGGKPVSSMAPTAPRPRTAVATDEAPKIATRSAARVSFAVLTVATVAAAVLAAFVASHTVAARRPIVPPPSTASLPADPRRPAETASPARPSAVPEPSNTVEIVDAAPPPRATPRHPPKRSPSPRSAPSPSPAPAPTTSANVRRDCPPFVIDETGHKKWNQECL